MFVATPVLFEDDEEEYEDDCPANPIFVCSQLSLRTGHGHSKAFVERARPEFDESDTCQNESVAGQARYPACKRNRRSTKKAFAKPGGIYCSSKCPPTR